MTTIRGDSWLKVLSDLQSNQLVNTQMASVLGLIPFHQDVNHCIENISRNPGLSLLLVDGFSKLFYITCTVYPQMFTILNPSW
jgi:hypothetical protein